MSEENLIYVPMRVKEVNNTAIIFEDGTRLYSDHDQDCCEIHQLNLQDLELEDFFGLEFDLTGSGFFRRINGYGIELIPIFGHSVKIAGHGYNNGYYSSNLKLVIESGEHIRTFDITECQNIIEG